MLPGIVVTGAVPQASIDATLPEQYVEVIQFGQFYRMKLTRFYSRTPIETVVKAYDLCLKDPSINGELIECSADKHFFLPRPEMANGLVTKRACTVWDPLFRIKHGEDSDLPDAIK